ncbi:MAG TPA: mannosyltransferase family protein [Frankiaceae bacterium]|nr:mannosyltransferase family protein [Frankiaceae bacterium]
MVTVSVRSAPAELGRRWQRLPDRQLVVAALGVWLSSRVAFAFAIWAGLFVDHPTTAARRTSFADAMYRWDAGWYLRIAQHWYFWPPFQQDRLGYGQGHIAFLPLPPLLIKITQLFTGSFALAGLLVSAAASAIALVALVRLVRLELGDLPDQLRDTGARAAPLLLAFSPYAVFLFLPYSEPVFLACAIPGWLAARQNRWRTAGLCLAGATAAKVNGLFLVAAVVVLYVQQRRQDGLPLFRPVVLWLLVPLTTIGAYFYYLHARTGDWNAWQHAQDRSWHRTPHGLWESWTITWHSAFGAGTETDYAWSRRAELLAAVLGLILIVVLLIYRRWAEALYITLSWFALASNGVYLSFPRSTLLWFPAFILLARAVAHRRWLLQGILSVTAPLAFVLGAAWASSAWVN